MKEIIIRVNKPTRIDKYLSENYPLLTTGILNKFARQNKIKLNGKKTTLSEKVILNDILNIYIEDRYFEKPTPKTAYLFSGKLPPIIYQDDNLLILNKPAGIPVIDENWKNYDTLINRVKKEFNDESIKLCHRLDTGTQGLVILSKNDETLEFMLEQFKQKNLVKTYYCICYGRYNLKNEQQKAYLYKDSKTSKALISPTQKNKDYKEILTNVKLIDSYKNYCLLEVELITGKTHQIRAHLASLNLPILGDSKYGINSLNRTLKLKYQTLASSNLKFKNIDSPNFKYLQGKEFSSEPAWFIDSFYNKEFI